MKMKNGTPMMAVRMPMGISVDAIRRQRSSTMSKYPAPMNMDVGSNTL